MPNDTQTTEDLSTIDVNPNQIALHNAAVIAKSEEQAAAGVGNSTDFNADTSGALDALVQAQSKTDEAADTEKPAETPPAEPVDPNPEEVAKAEADAKAKGEVKAAEEAKASDLFKDQPQLPTGASPKSHEAFTSIKIKAAQEISAREKQIEDLRKQLAERDEKLKSPIPKELTDEVEELRKFRARFDVDADPKFREFDTQVEKAHEFVYAQLKKSPAITDDVIELIKKHGGPENVVMSKIFAAMGDADVQRVVEHKLTEIATLKFNKAEAVKSTKANVEKYLAERQEQFVKSATAHNTATEKELGGLLGQFEFFKDRTVDAKADEPAKKAAAEHNQFMTETRSQLKEALQDDSPQMRAILLAGFVQLLHVKRELAAKNAAAESMGKQIKELEDKLGRFKSAGRLKSDESGASPAPKKTEKPSDEGRFSMRPGDALDAIRDQILQEKARANQ